MNIIDHIDKVFNKFPDIEKNNNNNIKEYININPSIVNISKKNTMKIQYQKTLNDNNNNNNIKINFKTNNEDDNYYSEFLKKIEEKVGNHSNQNTVMRKKNNHFLKPGMLKKEKSQANIKGNKFILNHSSSNNNITFKTRENINLHSPYHKKKISNDEEKKDENIIVLCKTKVKIDSSKNLKLEKELNNNNDAFNNNNAINIKKDTSIKEGYYATPNSNQNSYRNNNNELKKSPKLTTKKLKIYQFALEEKIQKPVQFEIINHYKKFDILEIQKLENFVQITESKTLKNVNQYLITINDKRIINNNKKNSELLKSNNFDNISNNNIENNKHIISNKIENKPKKKKKKNYCCFFN